MMEFSNILLVAGAGRNVGKTSLACELIRYFSSAYELVGVKISPHFHQKTHENELIHRSHHFVIYREINAESGKDSSRMLKAGAHIVYYIESADKYLFDALKVILPEIDSQPIVCESAALRKIVNPGIFIYIENSKASGSSKKEDQKEKADLIVYATENSLNFNYRDIHFDGRKWTLLKKGR